MWARICVKILFVVWVLFLSWGIGSYLGLKRALRDAPVDFRQYACTSEGLHALVQDQLSVCQELFQEEGFPWGRCEGGRWVREK